MHIERAADGWLVERANRYYHVNESWLEDMYRHQVKPYGNNPGYNRLLVAFRRGENADTILSAFRDFMDQRGAAKVRQKRSKAGGPEAVDPFQQFIKERRDAKR